MSESSPHSFSSEEIEAQAAAWVLRRDRGLTPTEQDEYLRWLAADPRHGRSLARHQQAWFRLDQLVEWKPEHSAQPNPDLLAVPRWRQAALIPFALAAAAAVIWVLVAEGPRFRKSGPAAGGSPTLVAQAPAPAENPGAPEYERRVLEDGSVVELNRGAVVEVNFTPGERRVRLARGEAHFTVAKNPHRPFLVEADGFGVRAVGTAFDVKIDPDRIEVLVTEGRVQLLGSSGGLGSVPAQSPGGRRTPALPTVAAGQQAVLSLGASGLPPRVSTVRPEEEETLLAWRPRLLSFTAAPLSEIAAEFNRHNEVQLVVADPELGALQVTASFHSNNVDGFVRLLESGFDVRADRIGSSIILHRNR